MGNPRRWRTAGLTTVLALVLTACAVPGRAEPAQQRCTATPPATPTGAPVVTVDDRVSFWLQNGRTAPLGLAVYADGTVIRAVDDGSPADPLPAMTIGRIEGCAVAAAVDALAGLADDDFGMPGVTDQVVTTVSVTRPGSAPVVLSVYALGIGDEYVDADQAAARAELSALIGDLDDSVNENVRWAPDRLRISRLASRGAGSSRTGTGGSEPARPWPLATPISDALSASSDRRIPCGVLDGADAAAVVTALAGAPALADWDDGTEVATLAIAVLVPGQPACAG